MGQLVDQLAALGCHFADAPLAAVVHLLQLAGAPVPFAHQFFHHLPLPVQQSAAPAQAHVGLDVQATAYQLQAFGLLPAEQVALQPAVQHDVGVQFILVRLAGKHRLLEVQAEAAHARVFAGVDLGQQQLERRLVGRFDALE